MDIVASPAMVAGWELDGNGAGTGPLDRVAPGNIEGLSSPM